VQEKWRISERADPPFPKKGKGVENDNTFP
jgi:hypothetical protein